MELDDLKTSWQTETEVYSQLNKKDMEQIHLILKEKASGSIILLKKKYERIISIMLGSMLLMICIFPFLSDGFSYPGSINGFAKGMFFYVILLFFYWQKLKSYNTVEFSDHIKLHLEQLLKMYKRNLRIEIAFLLLFFTTFIIAGRFFYGKGLENLNDPGVIAGFPLALIFTGAMIYLINKRYKKQIREMEEYLKEYEQSI